MATLFGLMRADLDALKIDRGARKPARRRRRARWAWRLVWVALLAAVAWIFQRPILELVDRLRLPEVRVARAVRREAGAAAALSGASANGYVVARTSAALSSDFPARLVEMNVVEGTRVSKGEVVARLYSEELRASLDAAEADLALAEASLVRAREQEAAAKDALPRLSAEVEAARATVDEGRARVTFAEADHRRVTVLVERSDVSRSRLDEATSQLDATRAQVSAARARLTAAEAALGEGERQVAVAAAAVPEAASRVAVARATVEGARATLDKTNIRAPFDGIVVRKEAEVGEVVSPNSQGGGSLTRGSVATMVDPASLEVQAEVPETTLPAVQIGAPARIYLDAWPGDAYPGRIDRIWPVADRQKATIEVRVAFERRDDRLRPEMGVRVVFLDERGLAEAEATDGPAAAVVMIPSNAAVRVGGRDGAFVLERDRVRFQELRFGEARAGRVAVDQGLDGSETVVLDPPPSLEDGDRVRTTEG